MIRADDPEGVSGGVHLHVARTVLIKDRTVAKNRKKSLQSPLLIRLARERFALIADMPELGTLDSQAAAALSGTAPMTRQSGKRTGKAFVTGGRVNVSQALYMPALVAARFNPDFAAMHQTMTARGKPPKVGLTGIMRKLIILANTLIKADRTWAPRPA